MALVAAPGAVSPQTPVRPAPPAVTAFVHVSVIPMDRERVLPDQTVLVRGGRIVALGPTKRVRIPAGAREIDGHGKFLLPGLADMHSHVKDEVGLFIYLGNGVTTIRDMSGKSDLMTLRQLQANGALLPPRLYGIAFLDDCEKQYPPYDACFATLKAAGHDILKLDHWVAASPARFDSVLAAARRVQLPLGGHVFPGPGLERALQARYRSVEHLLGYLDFLLGYRPSMVFDDDFIRHDAARFQRLQPLDVDPHRLIALSVSGIVPSLGIHGTPSDTTAWLRPGYRLDPQKLRSIAVATRRAGTWNAPTLTVYESMPFMRPDLPETVKEAVRRHVAFNFQIVKALHDAGAGLLLSTDFLHNRGIASGYAVHHELELLVRGAGLTPFEALATGTRDVAVYLGLQDSAGTVAVGKYADLVLLDKNPLQDIRNTTELAGVMAAGRWLSRAEIEARLDAFEAKGCHLADLRRVAARHLGMSDLWSATASAGQSSRCHEN